ncbi:hypothetical protein CJ177_20285 [Rhodococcus sp. ACPA1]|nr:hypothetical protein CJ177_20285 [Rhodococcus sp. ACPA1]
MSCVVVGGARDEYASEPDRRALEMVEKQRSRCGRPGQVVEMRTQHVVQRVRGNQILHRPGDSRRWHIQLRVIEFHRDP